MIAIDTTFGQHFDLDGDPLQSGYLYFGTANLNPVTNPVAVYWDAAGTLPAAQPIRTLNGYPVRNGTPALIYTSGFYSMLVRNKSGAQVFYVADSTYLPSGLEARLGSYASASVGAGAVAYRYTNNYGSRTTGLKLNSLGIWAVADLEMAKDGTDGAGNLTKLQAALTAGYIVHCEPGLFALTAMPTPVDGAGIIGSGAHWDMRPGYDYDQARQTIFKYTGATGANTCVLSASNLPVGTEGTDFTTPGTDDLVDFVMRDFHIDCDNKADIGLYIYRAGNGCVFENITVEKAVKRNIIISGCYSARFGTFGAFNCAEHGVDVGWDYFGWASVESTCFDFQASFILSNNGTAGTYVAGTGTDLDGTGGRFSVGRGSRVNITAQGNDGRACILTQYNMANAAGGASVYQLNYVEANADGPYIDYRTSMDGLRIVDGFTHSGSGGSLLTQDITLEAKNNSAVVTANDGPRNASDWIIFENLHGDTFGRGIAIKSNTYKFKVRECSPGLRFTTRRPQPEGVFGIGLFKADATLSDTRYINGQTRTDAFTGDGATVDFTLSASTSGGAFVEVRVNGTLKTVTTQYTVTGTTLHFTAGNEPANGAVIIARYSNMVLSRTAAGRYQVDFSEDQPDTEYMISLSVSQSAADAIAYWATKAVGGFEIRTAPPTALAAANDLGAFVDFTVSRLVDQP